MDTKGNPVNVTETHFIVHVPRTTAGRFCYEVLRKHSEPLASTSAVSLETHSCGKENHSAHFPLTNMN